MSDPTSWKLQVYTTGAGDAPDIVEDLPNAQAVVARIEAIKREYPDAAIGVHGNAHLPDHEVARLHQLVEERGWHLENLFRWDSAENLGWHDV